MGLPDPSASRVVLIGASRYDEDSLADLPAVANNLDKLGELFQDVELWGVPERNIKTVRNPTSRDEALEALRDAARSATDALFVYFAGHGLLDRSSSSLYLALPRASYDELHRAILYDDLRRAITAPTCRALSKVVVLDCCYSGTAMPGYMASSLDIADQARIDGTYLMTASAENKLALAVPGETYTAFTAELVRTIERGVADGADLLDMGTLYVEARAALLAKGRTEPQERARNGGRSITLFRNRLGGGAAGDGDAGIPRRQPRSIAAFGGSRGRTKRRAVLGCGLALLLVGASFTAADLAGAFGADKAAGPPVSSSKTAQPPVVSSATGPVMVTDTTFMRDDGTPGAWSYGFAQVLSPADVASYSAVAQSEQQYQQWAFGKGGVTADDDRIQIGLRGNENGTVVVQNVGVTKHCEAPLNGTLLYVPPQGQTGDIGIYLDLDQQFPVPEDPATHESYFGASGDANTITLTHGEVATILLDAVTSRYYCSFSLTLDVETDSGQEVSEVVDNGGKPFQVTAAAGTGSSVPFSSYHALYIQNGAEDGLISENPQQFGRLVTQPTTTAGN